MLAYKVLINNPRRVDKTVGAQSMCSNEQLHKVFVGHTLFPTTHSGTQCYREYSLNYHH